MASQTLRPIWNLFQVIVTKKTAVIKIPANNWKKFNSNRARNKSNFVVTFSPFYVLHQFFFRQSFCWLPIVWGPFYRILNRLWARPFMVPRQCTFLDIHIETKSSFERTLGLNLPRTTKHFREKFWLTNFANFRTRYRNGKERFYQTR